MLNENILRETLENLKAQKYAAEGGIQVIEHLLSLTVTMTEQEFSEAVVRGQQQEGV